MLRKTLSTLILTVSCIITPFFAKQAIANESNLVQLDGSGSEDADGDQLIYNWRQISGPKINLLNANTAKPSFYPEIAGDYAFELVVSDGRVKSTPAIVNVNIEEANEIPVAILPSKISVELGESITLDGSASCDADNDALLYNFSQVSGPAEILRSTVSQESKFSVIPKAIGTYSFELIVNDGRANSDPALCVVEVSRPNSAPVARVVAPQKTIIKTRHRFNNQNPVKASANNTHHIVIPKSAQAKHGNNNTKAKTLKAKVHLAKASKMPKIVEEIDNLSSAQPLNITPIASTSGDMSVRPGSKVVIKGFGVDPDGDSLQFIWNQTSGPIIPGSPVMRKNLAFIPRKEGTYVFELIVNDGKTKSDPATCSITVKNTRGTSVRPVKLDDAEVMEDINSLELSIPSEADSIQANAVENTDDDDISFRELFSID